MALIPVQHVLADNFPVDPDWDSATDADILAGSTVKLASTGYVALTTATTDVLLGLAGDTLAATGPTTANAEQVVVNGNGATRYTQNRVADFYNETLASGKMTVYHGGGRFLTTQFSTGSYTPGSALYLSTDDGYVAPSGTVVVGVIIAGPGEVASGVPGVDASSGTSMSLPAGELLEFVLKA